MYPWHDTFHMGIVHFMAFPYAQADDEILKSVHTILTDEFFQAIEMSVLLRDEILERISSQCEIAEVEFLLAAQPLILSQKLNLNSPNEEERLRAVQICKDHIDRSYQVRARTLAFLSGRNDVNENKEVFKEVLKDKLVLSLEELCRHAQEKSLSAGYCLGVNLEVFDHVIDKKALIGPAPDAFDVAKKVKANFPNFSLTVDLSHIPLLFEDPLYVLKLLAPFVGHIHIGNGVLEKGHTAYGDTHPRFGIAGGCNTVQEVANFLEALQKIGYFEQQGMTQRPVISFEVKPLPGEESDLVVANAKRTFLTALDRVQPK